MKKVLIVILLVIGYQNLMAHGGHIAAFKYQIEATSITLEFQIENSILQHFDLKKQCKSYETTTAWCLVQYINANSVLKINDSKVSFELESSRKNDGFFIIKMIAKGDFSNCKNITLNNKCFLEFDREFENRIVIQKDNATKSYLLNRKHTALTIE